MICAATGGLASMIQLGLDNDSQFANSKSRIATWQLGLLTSDCICQCLDRRGLFEVY